MDTHTVLYSSPLCKRSKSHQWQQKWFVLRRNQLSYYKDSSEYKALRVINLDEVLCVTEIPDNHPFHFIIVTNERIFHLRALDAKTYQAWVHTLNTLINNEGVMIDIEQQQQQEMAKDTLTFNSLAACSPEHVLRKGFIHRLRKRYNQWESSYLLLTNHFLFFFKTYKDYGHSRIHKQINVKDVLDIVELEPLSASKRHCLLIITPWKRIRVCAESEEDMTKWLVLLKTLSKLRRERV